MNVNDLDLEKLRALKGVCLDIDDTLSTHGKLTAPAYDALWKLKEAGLLVVPVTGRPAGWCDHIARFWPVDAVVGENGAFTFWMEGGKLKRSETPGADPEHTKKLGDLRTEIRAKFPEARWASDQAYREYDLAIDICEDVMPWPKPQVDELLKLCAALGAHAKLSSIHVNAWFGSYDKRIGFAHALKHCPALMRLKRETPYQELLFIGDSPNDEPMFQVFDQSVGVANLKQYLPSLKHPPKHLTDQQSGEGFSEMAEMLLKAR